MIFFTKKMKDKSEVITTRKLLAQVLRNFWRLSLITLETPRIGWTQGSDYTQFLQQIYFCKSSINSNKKGNKDTRHS